MRMIPVLLLAAFSASAQTATDFTISDVDGVSRNLFTELDNDNVVVLKFFTNWCTICNATADEVVSIYNGYQTNGDAVVFWALDRDQNETNADAIAYRNNNGIPFPVIGEAYSVAQQCGVVYQPEYYIIRPDRSYVKRTNYSAMQTAVNDALASLTSIADVGQLREKIVIRSNSITWMASPEKLADLHIYDVSGRKVMDKRIRGEEQIQFEVPPGVYLYRLTDEAGLSSTGKLGIAR